MEKNWAKTGARVALLTAGFVVIGSGAAYGEPLDPGKATAALAPVIDTVQKVTQPGIKVPAAPLAKKHLDEPQPVLPGGPVQSSAINTAPALAAVATAQKNLEAHAPGGKAAMDGVDKAGAAVKNATGNAPKTLARKQAEGPIPGVSNKQISIPANADKPGNLGTPLDKVGDPGKAIGGAVASVAGAVGQPDLASQ